MEVYSIQWYDLWNIKKLHTLNQRCFFKNVFSSDQKLERLSQLILEIKTNQKIKSISVMDNIQDLIGYLEYLKSLNRTKIEIDSVLEKLKEISK